MLVSQMYHMDGQRAGCVLVWAAGTFLAGLLIRSNPALAFALVLFSIWGMWETGQREAYTGRISSVGSVALHSPGSAGSPACHLSGLALTGFIVTYGYINHTSGGHEAVVLAGTVIGALAALGLAKLPKLETVWRGGIVYALIVIFSGLFALQFPQISGTGEVRCSGGACACAHARGGLVGIGVVRPLCAVARLSRLLDRNSGHLRQDGRLASGLIGVF